MQNDMLLQTALAEKIADSITARQAKPAGLAVAGDPHTNSTLTSSTNYELYFPSNQ